MYFLYCSLLSQSFQRSLLAFPRPRRESGCKGRAFLRSRQTLRRKNCENVSILTFVHCRRGGMGRNAGRSHYYIYAPRGSGTCARTTEARRRTALTAGMETSRRTTTAERSGVHAVTDPHRRRFRGAVAARTSVSGDMLTTHRLSCGNVPSSSNALGVSPLG